MPCAGWMVISVLTTLRAKQDRRMQTLPVGQTDYRSIARASRPSGRTTPTATLRRVALHEHGRFLPADPRHVAWNLVAPSMGAAHQSGGSKRASDRHARAGRAIRCSTIIEGVARPA